MSSDVRVVDYRCVARRGDLPFEEHHERTCISFVWSGSFGYRVGARTATLGPGAVMLGNAGAPYVCSHDDAGGDRCLAVSYDQATIAQIAAAVGIGDGDAPFRVPALPPLAHAGGYAYAIAAALRGAITWSVEEVAFELAAWALREQAGLADGRRPDAPSARDRRRAVDAMLFLDERSGDPLGLADVARVAELSPFHFLRTFRATIGVTPHQYLVRRRLVQSAALLLDTNAPITAIAFDVGFNDLAHFIRSFGRAFGCSPRAFRRAGGLPATCARNAKSRRGTSAT